MLIPPNKKYLLGITGKMGSGKDTVCKLLEIFLYPLVRLSIADPIKQELAAELGITTQELEKRKSEPEMRVLLQRKGEDIKRYTALWAASYYKIPCGAVVCTDIRYVYNSNCIKEIGGQIVRVFREPVKKAEVILMPEEVENHVSENEVDKIQYDYSIRNTGSMRILENEVKYLAQNLKERWKLL